MVVKATRHVVAAGALVLGLVLAVPFASAADRPGAAPASALEFRLDDSFSLEHLAGTTVSWRQFSGETSSWRLGVTPAYYRSDQSSELGTSKHRSQSLSVEWQRLRGFASRSRARPYWGFGVLAGVEHAEDVELSEPYGYDGSRESTTYQAGVLGTLGAEFVIADRVTLGAEYASTLTWSHRREQAVDDYHGDDRTTFDSRRTTYALGTRAVALTVGILF